jgi:hypothetical protein
MADKLEMPVYAFFDKTRGYYKAPGLETEKVSIGTSDIPAYDYFTKSCGRFQDTGAERVSTDAILKVPGSGSLGRSVKSYEKSRN